MNAEAGAKGRVVETLIEATPAPGVSLDELERKLRELGNPIHRVDRDRGVVILVHQREVADG